MLAPLTLGLLGCPVLLSDDFIALPRDRSPGGAGTSGFTPDSGAAPPAPPADGGGGPSVCVFAAESCDGRDNDCDDVIDNPPACSSGCAGAVFEGRGAMFCGGAGVTFASAEARCSTQGMRPVTIDSAQKSAAVLQAIEVIYAPLSTISEAQSAIWVDAHDGETEGTWHWGLSGTVFWLGDATGSAQNGAYVNWASGKPNNSGSGEGDDEDCAVMHVSIGPDAVGTWNDETCLGLHAFLCEAPPP